MTEWNGPLFGMLLDSSLRVSLVAAIVAIILITLRVRASAVRHAAWTAVLLAMLLMPVLPYCVPSIAVPVGFPSGNLSAVSDVSELPPPPRVSESPGMLSSAGAPVMLPASVADAPPTRGPIWPVAALAVYGMGVAILGFRLLLGWRSMERIAGASRRIVFQADGETDSVLRSGAPLICESELVAAPLTAGVFSSKIILPVTWRLWPREKLRAVLAHELAHARRRDPLIGLLAHLNRCIFWFHPLAWWLERKLASMAEHACDDAAVCAIGETRRYAEVLLDMAEAVRRSGGRFSWHGIGVNGNGFLGQRIDRILRGDLFRVMSRPRKVVVAISCAAAIFMVVACRRQAAPPAPLQEDPKLATEQAQEKA